MLTGLATGAAGLAIAEPGEVSGRSLLRAWGLFAAVGLVASPAGRCVARLRPGPGISSVVVPLAALVRPFAIDGARLTAGSGADPLEIFLLAALRNLGIGLALMADHAQSARPAAVVSLFLILASSCVAEGPIVVGLLAAYSLVSGAWLAASY
jgi:hypothetical protein